MQLYNFKHLFLGFDLLDFSLRLLFNSSQWWHLKCWSHAQCKSTYKLSVFCLSNTVECFFPLFVCFTYYFLNTRVATSERRRFYTDVSSRQPKSLCWENVWLWAGLPHWAMADISLWLCDFMWNETERSSGGKLLCCLLYHFTVKKSKNNNS